MPSVFFGRIGGLAEVAGAHRSARVGLRGVRGAVLPHGSAVHEGGGCARGEGGGEEMVPQVELLTRPGIPVMAHIGFTRSPNTALGYRVQRHGEDAQGLVSAAKALEAAGAFAVLIEMVLARFGAWLSWR
ncbi:3-methyl-2-oxobutanoate hydroxymethyltransferase [Streptomyces bobili]|nr:3-methyl-2-oxobutanoate hydroxymethyltransferase [Streptomyces bobili]